MNALKDEKFKDLVENYIQFAKEADTKSADDKTKVSDIEKQVGPFLHKITGEYGHVSRILNALHVQTTNPAPWLIRPNIKQLEKIETLAQDLANRAAAPKVKALACKSLMEILTSTDEKRLQYPAVICANPKFTSGLSGFAAASNFTERLTDMRTVFRFLCDLLSTVNKCDPRKAALELQQAYLSAFPPRYNENILTRLCAYGLCC